MNGSTQTASPSWDSLFEHLDAEQRELIRESPRQNRLPLLAQLRREKEIDTLRALGEVCQLPVIDQFDLAERATEVIPLRMIHEYQCLPMREEEAVGSSRSGSAPTSAADALDGAETPESTLETEQAVSLVTVWPPDADMDDWVYAVTGRRPRWHLGPSKRIVETITQHFGVGSASLTGGDISAEEDFATESDDAEDENAALIRFVNEIIQKAVDDRATDIHVEPLRDSLQIRYRIDGELVPIRVPDNLRRYQAAIISRLKIMSRLNISEKRRPQDGRIDYRSSGDELDIRISSMPVKHGEKLVLRLLNQKSQPLSFEELGMLPEDRQKIQSVLELPHGIILVTGPTGSGKSTSLNAFIRTINSPGRNIITIEDPVEYEVPGVNQSQVNEEIGFTFAAALRHVLRQDPDVIMVGEIRDQITADLAIRAALTGHLVLSTIHTNDAPGAVTRLIDLDVEPFLVASAVELIIAQRLVRRLCPHCRRPQQLSRQYREECLRALRVEPSEEDLSAPVYGPVGCEHCRGLGYQGRVGIFEIMRVGEELHDLIVGKESARAIRHRALETGMTTLQHSGWQQVRLGKTSLPEIMRFAAHGEEHEEEPGSILTLPAS